jgi:FtsH-binding integral membrane protein
MSQGNFIENVQNLLWLVLALASISLWWARWSAQKKEKQSKQARRSLLAVGCVLLVLFFAISLSDDLQEISVLVEYTGSSPRILQDVKRAFVSFDSGKKFHLFPILAELVRLLSFSRAFLGQVILADAPSPRSALCWPVQGRAPPR